MTNAHLHIDLRDVNHGDQVRVTFDPALRDCDAGVVDSANGEIVKIVGLTYLASDDHRSSLGLPCLLRINTHPGIQIELIEDHDSRKKRKATEARGEVIYPDPPRCAAELEDQLMSLAAMIPQAPSKGLRSRRDELQLQFNDIADIVQLAKSKRTYLLTKAIIGHDFHPWTTKDDRVFRIRTERPLPADLDLDKKQRKDRARRLDESIRIFGEAERETRQYASLLRSAGYDVRRPHPNAQELLIRIRWNSKQSADMVLKPTSNGLWGVGARGASNKAELRAKARLTREGHVSALRVFLGLL